jgi:3-methyladenine DNA glycosylase AlkD
VAGAWVGEADRLEAALRAQGSPERAVSEKAYLKSDLEFAGVPLPVLRAMVRAWATDQPGLDHDGLTALTVALWGRGLYECRGAAVELLVFRGRLLEADDAALIERLLRTAQTWALVDPLSEIVMGGLTERFPRLAVTLDRWARDDNFWVRRAAMLALLRPLRRGDGDFARFAGYADRMLDEQEFFIRKAIGWILRDTGRRRPDLVAGWLAPRVHRASGVTMREAVKPLPDGVRDQLMAGYRAKQPVELS